MKNVAHVVKILIFADAMNVVIVMVIRVVVPHHTRLALDAAMMSLIVTATKPSSSYRLKPAAFKFIVF
jgi:hypothetical protein